MRGFGARFGALAVAAMASIAVVFEALAARHVRFVADDMCVAASVQSQGVYRAQAIVYTTHSGRFVSTGAGAVMARLGEWTAVALPIVTLALWVAVSARVVVLVERRIGVAANRALWAFAIATTFVAACVISTPSPFQSVYWQTGNLAYLAPVVVVTALAAILLRRAEATHWYDPVLLVLLGFLSGGFSETSTFVIALALPVIGLCVRRRRRVVTGWAWTLAGAVPGIALELAAPGNARRMRTSHSEPVVIAVRHALHESAHSVRALITHHPVALLVCVALGVALRLVATHPASTGRDVPTTHVLALVALGVLAVAAFFPSELVGSVVPPPRMQLIPTVLVFVAALLAGGVLADIALGRAAHRTHQARRWAMLGAVALSAVLLASVASGTIAVDGAMAAYAAAKDSQSAAANSARLAGVPSVILPRLGDTTTLGVLAHGFVDDAGVNEIDLHRGRWYDRCAGAYFRVAVTAPPPAVPTELSDR